MGIDCGDVRTGIAVSDPLGILACGVGTFKAPGRRALIEIILEQAGKYEIEEFVVGNPINMNGTVGDRSQKAQKFAAELEKVSGPRLFPALTRKSKELKTGRKFQARQRVATRLRVRKNKRESFRPVKLSY